jgi:hypothetical protein
VVTFSTEVKTKLVLTPMTEQGKRTASSCVKSLQAEQMTNLWGGLRRGLDIAVDDIDGGGSGARNSHVLLLTDGLPNCNPARGIRAALAAYKETNEQLQRVSVHTFGFGYDLDSPLLNDIADAFHGQFLFIPDGTFVGTVFVNALANIMTTVARNARLELHHSVVQNNDDVDFDIDVDVEVLAVIGSVRAGQPLTLRLPSLLRDDDKANGGDVSLVLVYDSIPEVCSVAVALPANSNDDDGDDNINDETATATVAAATATARSIIVQCLQKLLATAGSNAGGGGGGHCTGGGSHASGLRGGAFCHGGGSNAGSQRGGGGGYRQGGGSNAQRSNAGGDGGGGGGGRGGGGNRTGGGSNASGRGFRQGGGSNAGGGGGGGGGGSAGGGGHRNGGGSNAGGGPAAKTKSVKTTELKQFQCVVAAGVVKMEALISGGVAEHNATIDATAATMKQLSAMLQDLSGQVSEAVSTTAFWKKWGAHYVRSLLHAHRYQVCHNFKDPGVQAYGGARFRALQAQFDDTFCALPPPQPPRNSGYSWLCEDVHVYRSVHSHKHTHTHTLSLSPSRQSATQLTSPQLPFRLCVHIRWQATLASPPPPPSPWPVAARAV